MNIFTLVNKIKFLNIQEKSSQWNCVCFLVKVRGTILIEQSRMVSFILCAGEKLY